MFFFKTIFLSKYIKFFCLICIFLFKILKILIKCTNLFEKDEKYKILFNKKSFFFLEIIFLFEKDEIVKLLLNRL